VRRRALVRRPTARVVIIRAFARRAECRRGEGLHNVSGTELGARARDFGLTVFVQQGDRTFFLLFRLLLRLLLLMAEGGIATHR
jgi:hypothetical protein